MQLSQIKAINLIEVFSSRTKLITKSNKLWCCCLLHTEKTPSCVVDSKKFHCFGCGKTGDIITLYMQLYSLSFIQAVRKICDQYNIAYESKPIHASNNILEQACKHYQSNVHLAAMYIKERGITEESCNFFRIGYANSNNLIQYLIRNRFSASAISAAGLLYRNSLDPMCNRLIFPLINHENHVVGFAGRTLHNAIPKYLNTAETDVFHKSSYMYGEQLLTTESNFAIIVEGYMDVISLYQAGIKNAVAVMGTAINDYHIKTLFSYVNTVYVMMDSDQAGIASIVRSLPVLCKYINNVRQVHVCELHGYKDADEAVRSGKTSALYTALQSSCNVIEWAIRNHNVKADQKQMNEQQKLNHKISLLRLIKTLCTHIENPETSSVYQAHYSAVFSKRVSKPTTPVLKVFQPEREVLSLLLQNPGIIHHFSDNILNTRFSNKSYEGIRTVLSLALLHKHDIRNTLLIIRADFPEVFRSLRQKTENTCIIMNRNFMLEYISNLFAMIKTEVME
jgi:DNA primase